MLEKLERWHLLLGISGKNTKKRVRDEINHETIRLRNGLMENDENKELVSSVIGTLKEYRVDEDLISKLSGKYGV